MCICELDGTISYGVKCGHAEGVDVRRCFQVALRPGLALEPAGYLRSAAHAVSIRDSVVALSCRKGA